MVLRDSAFTLTDWVVVAFLLLSVLYVGFRAGRSNKSKTDYALGGKSLNPRLVGLSLFATLFSTISYISYPGEMIKYGPSFCMGIITFPIIYLVVSRLVIPKITSLNVTSAYEILEIKLGRHTRNLATLFFVSLRFLWMSTIIYATVGSALCPIIGFDPKWIPAVCICVVLFTVLYTSVGGMKAVVITDSLQSLIMFLGVALTIVVILCKIGPSVIFGDSSVYSHWLKIDFVPRPLERMNVGNSIVMNLVWYICTSSSDQMSIQRYLSVKDSHEASRSFKISLITNATAQLMLALVGMLVLAYFVNLPQQLAPGMDVIKDADILFPRFITVGLPAGVTGLIAAALLSAAMSSLSSGLNSTSVVIEEDIIKRMSFFKNRNFSVRSIKAVVVILGICVAFSSSMVGHVHGNLYDITVKVVNLVVAPLAVLFFMALLVPFATDRATFTAGCLAMVSAIAMSFFDVFSVGLLWIQPIALLVGMLTGVAFSALDTFIMKKAEKGKNN